MKMFLHAALIAISVLSASYAQEVCDFTCAQDLEDWNNGDNKPCDQSVDKLAEIQSCRLSLRLDEQSPCTEEQKQIAEAVFAEIEAYLNIDCTRPVPTDPPVLDCSSEETTNEINKKIMDCKPNDISGLALNKYLSQINTCRRLQQILDCISEAMGECKSDSGTEALVSGEIVSYLMLGELFECSLKVDGNAITKKIIGCQYVSMLKCYNPVLKAFGMEEISDSYDILSIDGAEIKENIIDKITQNTQDNQCSKASSVSWDSILQCTSAAEAKCPYISGMAAYDVTSININPRSAVTELWVKYQMISSLKKVRDICNTAAEACGQYSERESNMEQCISQLSMNVKNNAACSQIQSNFECITQATRSCGPLIEAAGFKINAIQNGAATITRCVADTSKIMAPSSLCSPSAQLQAYSNARKCSVKMNIAQLINNQAVCNNAQSAANCLNLAAGTCAPVAKYFYERYAFFFGYVNYNFGCQVSLSQGGVQITATEHQQCSYQSAMNCYKPILDKYGVSLDSQGKITLDNFKKLIIDINQRDLTQIKSSTCSKMSGLDFAALKGCAATCVYPIPTLSPDMEYQTQDHTYLTSTGNLFDIRGLEMFNNQLCSSGCSSFSLDQVSGVVSGCVSSTAGSKLETIPKKIFYSHYLQKCDPSLSDFSDACGAHNGVEGCLSQKQGTCPFLQTLAGLYVRDDTRFSAAGDLCGNSLQQCTPFPKPGPGGNGGNGGDTSTDREPKPSAGAISPAIPLLLVTLLTIWTSLLQ